MKKITTLEDHLSKRYGEIGTPKRDAFEANAKAFLFGEMLKEARREANLSQQDVATRVGITQSLLASIEKGAADISLAVLVRIVEVGLGKKISFFIQ
ncbi:helix-turn-helix domain-containing protein [Hugenholtzia roseola]|uniref:helix-turn-helix domain-containing protein n=1 Tax=Hugenholtzia roseola TaxID=1002 RepID=UPI000429AC46|nr:helix-turn-helix transcriptional regulator [Hugenholtzia roseola]